MEPISFSTSKYIVLSGHATAAASIMRYDPPGKVYTAHPNVESFDDPQAAIDRAIELGVPGLLTQEFWPEGKSFNVATGKLVDLAIEDFDPGAHYQPGAVVRYTITEDVDDGEGGTEQVSTELTFLKISDAHPSVPDLVFDLGAGTGDWIVFEEKPAPVPTPEPSSEEQRIAALESEVATLESEVAALENRI